MKFERVRNTLELCLSQIQNIVPSLLAAKVCCSKLNAGSWIGQLYSALF